jgi:general secretion pathway protein C
MRARILAFVVWALVAATAMFWLLRLVGGGVSAPTHTVSVAGADTPRGDWSRIFAIAPASAETAAPVQDVAAASRFKLVGVAAPRWAVIAVDGKPPRSVGLGSAVDGRWVVQSIKSKEVAIGPPGEAAVVTLALATLPPPATGNLLPPNAGGAGAVPPQGPRSGAPMIPPVVMSVPPDAMAPSAVLPAPPKLQGGSGAQLVEESNSDAPPVMPNQQR